MKRETRGPRTVGGPAVRVLPEIRARFSAWAGVVIVVVMAWWRNGSASGTRNLECRRIALVLDLKEGWWIRRFFFITNFIVVSVLLIICCCVLWFLVYDRACQFPPASTKK